MKEAERIHVEEEELLRKQMNSKKAKEEAERLHRVITTQQLQIQLEAIIIG